MTRAICLKRVNYVIIIIEICTIKKQKKFCSGISDVTMCLEESPPVERFWDQEHFQNISQPPRNIHLKKF